MTTGMSSTPTGKPARTPATHTASWSATPGNAPAPAAQERVLELVRHLDKTARLSTPLVIHLAPAGATEHAGGDIGLVDRTAEGGETPTVDLLLSDGHALARRIATALPWSELPARLTRLMRNYQVEGCNKDSFATWTRSLSDADLRERLGDQDIAETSGARLCVVEGKRNAIMSEVAQLARPDTTQLAAWNEQFRSLQPQALLAWGAERWGQQMALTCSFGGVAGMVLLDMVLQVAPATPILYIDTGLLFPETYQLIEQIETHYGITPWAVRPRLSVAEQAQDEGDALWARDPNRCCAIRKVQPLNDTLAPYAAWIAGIRREGAKTRANAEMVEWSTKYNLVKLSRLSIGRSDNSGSIFTGITCRTTSCWTVATPRSAAIPAHHSRPATIPAQGAGPASAKRSAASTSKQPEME